MDIFGGEILSEASLYLKGLVSSWRILVGSHTVSHSNLLDVGGEQPRKLGDQGVELARGKVWSSQGEGKGWVSDNSHLPVATCVASFPALLATRGGTVAPATRSAHHTLLGTANKYGFQQIT